MKNELVFYSICSYVPSILRGESVNLGFAYHVPSTKEIGFVNTKNYRRVMSFDDELTRDDLQHLIGSLKYDFSIEYIREYEDDVIKLMDKGPELLQAKTYNYINQIQFREIKAFPLEKTLNNVLQDIKDLFLYYDKKPNERIDASRVKALTKKIISMSDLKNTLELAPRLNTFYQAPYDFKVLIDGEETYIKSFTFDYRNPSNLYKELKSYFYDLEHSEYIENWRYKNIQIVINNTDYNKNFEREIINSLPEQVKINTLEEFANNIKTQTSFKSLFS